MKHIAIALALLATLAIEARAQDGPDQGYLSDYAGARDEHGGLGIERLISARVSAGRAPRADIEMLLRPNVLGRSLANLHLDVDGDGAWGAHVTLSLAGVLVAVEAGSHIDVDIPSARESESSCFLAIVGAKLVSFDITVTAEMDLDIEATGRSRRVFLDPRTFRIVATTPAFARVDGTAHATILGSVDVHTRGARAVYALKFFDGTLTARNLSANERWVLVRPGEYTCVGIEPVSMYIFLMAYPYRLLLVRAVAPSEYRDLVFREEPV